MRRAKSLSVLLILAFSILLLSEAGHQALGGGKGKGATGTPPGLHKKEGKLPSGFHKGEKRGFIGGLPPGWSKGEKEGWRDKLPPGLDPERDKEKLKAFNKKLENAEKRLKKKVGAGKLKGKDADEACMYMSLAARRGVPVNEASELVSSMLDRGADMKSIEKASRAYAYGADKKADFRGLGGFVTRKLKEGLRGDELARAIYEEIDKRAHTSKGK